MQKRNLGKSGLTASAIGLGCMSMSGTYGKGDDSESVKTVHHALDQGVNFLDSSDMYGWGHNEELLAKVLKERRNEIVLATKFGNLRGSANGRPEYVPQACEASLKRLGVEVIDLYYQHRVDPAVPIEETVGAMARLLEEGKVRALGLSEAAPQTVRRAVAEHPIAALQSEYSLMYPGPAEAALPLCREFGIAFVAYSPLGRGLLTGQIRSQGDMAEDDRRLQHPRFQGEHLEHNLGILRNLEAIAAEKGCKPSQLVLAWLLAQGEDIIPIPGTKRAAYLDENLGALAVNLTPEECEQIRQAVPAGGAMGGRYPEAQLKGVQI